MKKITTAVIQFQGKQFIVKAGDKIVTDKITGEPGTTITVDDVLLVVEGDKRQIGNPLVKDAQVILKIDDQFRDKKIRVATYKAKSRYRRVKGHKQHKTTLTIDKIKA